MTVIAIDGPAASGKSSVSRRIAAALGFAVVNSGALYRAVTREMILRGIDVSHPNDVERELPHLGLVCEAASGEGCTVRTTTSIDGAHLRDEAVNARVSGYAALPAVRRFVNAELHRVAATCPVVMEGRDIGTAVFPETPFKIYIDASPEVRNARRAREGLSDRISERDRLDSSRTTDPLRVAAGAFVLDTSDLDLDQVCARVLDHLASLGLPSR